MTSLVKTAYIMHYNVLMISLPTNYPLSEITIKLLTNEKIKKLHHYKKKTTITLKSTKNKIWQPLINLKGNINSSVSSEQLYSLGKLKHYSRLPVPGTVSLFDFASMSTGVWI